MNWYSQVIVLVHRSYMILCSKRMHSVSTTSPDSKEYVCICVKHSKGCMFVCVKYGKGCVYVLT